MLTIHIIVQLLPAAVHIQPTRLELHIHLAEHADAKCNNRKVKAKAAERAHVSNQTQLGQIVVDVLLTVDADIKVQRNAAASAELRCYRDRAKPAVYLPCVVYAKARSKAAI